MVNGQAGVFECALYDGLRRAAAGAGQECNDEPDAVPRRNFLSRRDQISFDQPIRNSGHHAGAVSRAVRRTGTAVVKAVETVDSEANDAVRRDGRSIRDEADTTCIVVHHRLIQRVATHLDRTPHVRVSADVPTTASRLESVLGSAEPYHRWAEHRNPATSANRDGDRLANSANRRRVPGVLGGLPDLLWLTQHVTPGSQNSASPTSA